MPAIHWKLSIQACLRNFASTKYAFFAQHHQFKMTDFTYGFQHSGNKMQWNKTEHKQTDVYTLFFNQSLNNPVFNKTDC